MGPIDRPAGAFDAEIPTGRTRLTSRRRRTCAVRA